LFFPKNSPDPKLAYIIAIAFSAIIVIIIPLAFLVRYKCCNDLSNPYLPNQGDPETHTTDDNSQDDIVLFMQQPTDRVTLTRQTRRKIPVKRSCCSCWPSLGKQGQAKIDTATCTDQQNPGSSDGTTADADSTGYPQGTPSDTGVTSTDTEATSNKLPLDAGAHTTIVPTQSTSLPLMSGPRIVSFVSSTPILSDTTVDVTLESSGQTTLSPELDCVANLKNKFDEASGSGSAFESSGQGCVWAAAGSRSPSPIPLVHLKPNFNNSQKKSSPTIETGFDDVATRHDK
jgi:hypothetical protein